jgi:hypothetical protein
MPRQSSRVVRNEREVKRAKSDGMHCVEYRVPRVPNLVLRCQPGGQKSWKFNFRLKRERKWRSMSLGRWPAVDLDHARDEAQRHTVDVRSGKDPSTRQAKPLTTFRDLAADYMAEHEHKHTARWHRERARILKTDVLLSRALIGRTAFQSAVWRELRRGWARVRVSGDAGPRLRAAAV